MNDVADTPTLQPLSLRRNFSWTFGGNVVYAGCRWGILVVLAKLGSAEMVGQLVLGLAIAEPVIAFLNLQLRTVLATDANHEYRFDEYLVLRLFTAMLALLLVTGVAIAVGYRWETFLIIVAVGLSKAIDSLSDMLYGLLQQYERMDRIAKSMIMKGLLALVLFAVTLYLTDSLFWGTLGLALAWTIILAGYDARNALLILRTATHRKGGEGAEGKFLTMIFKPRLEMGKLISLSWIALPLAFVTLLSELNNNAARYFIERYLGERELGIFGALAYLMLAGFAVVNALAHVAGPRLAKYYAARNLAAFRTLLLRLIGLGGLLGIAGCFAAWSAGEWILTLLYQPEYAEHGAVFFWLMTAAGISYVAAILGCGILATRQFSRLMVPNMIVTASSFGLSMILIPSFGLVGAAWTTCAAGLLSCGMFLFILAILGRP